MPNLTLRHSDVIQPTVFAATGDGRVSTVKQKLVLKIRSRNIMHLNNTISTVFALDRGIIN